MEGNKINPEIALMARGIFELLVRRVIVSQNKTAECGN